MELGQGPRELLRIAAITMAVFMVTMVLFIAMWGQHGL
jgi:hypothetical protein